MQSRVCQLPPLADDKQRARGSASDAATLKITATTSVRRREVTGRRRRRDELERKGWNLADKDGMYRRVVLCLQHVFFLS